MDFGRGGAVCGLGGGGAKGNDAHCKLDAARSLCGSILSLGAFLQATTREICSSIFHRGIGLPCLRILSSGIAGYVHNRLAGGLASLWIDLRKPLEGGRR